MITSSWKSILFNTARYFLQHFLLSKAHLPDALFDRETSRADYMIHTVYCYTYLYSSLSLYCLYLTITIIIMSL
jgi:hypothetical protein